MKKIIFLLALLVISGCSLFEPVSPPGGSNIVAYGSMMNNTYDQYNTLDIGVSGVYYNITFLYQGETKGMEFNNSALIVQSEGKYLINYGFSFTGGNNNEYGIGVFKNYDVDADRNCYVRRHTSSNAVGNVGTSCIMDLNVGDTLSFMVDDELNPPTNINVYSITITAIKI